MEEEFSQLKISYKDINEENEKYRQKIKYDNLEMDKLNHQLSD